MNLIVIHLYTANPVPVTLRTRGIRIDERVWVLAARTGDTRHLCTTLSAEPNVATTITADKTKPFGLATTGNPLPITTLI